MGVFDKAKRVSGITASDDAAYVCLNCETTFEVQHHACPVCESYDLRYARWVQEA